MDGDVVALTGNLQTSVPSSRFPRIVYLRDVLLTLVNQDMKVRYKDSALGMAWSLINPLLHLLIFYFLFKVVLSLNIRRYSGFAFTGLLSWTWFHSSLSSAAGTIKANRDLIRQPGFPVGVLPIASVTTNLVNFLMALPFLVILLFFTGTKPSLVILLLPAIIALQFALSLGFSYLLAALNVFFRDTQHILAIVLQLFFFLTPIFYDAQSVPGWIRPIYNLNPMVHVVSAYRAVLMNGMLPEFGPLIVTAAFSIPALFAAYSLFRRTSCRFMEEV